MCGYCLSKLKYVKNRYEGNYEDRFVDDYGVN